VIKSPLDDFVDEIIVSVGGESFTWPDDLILTTENIEEVHIEYDDTAEECSKLVAIEISDDEEDDDYSRRMSKVQDFIPEYL
jgi:hypothetical protein